MAVELFRVSQVKPAGQLTQAKDGAVASLYVPSAHITGSTVVPPVQEYPKGQVVGMSVPAGQY